MVFSAPTQSITTSAPFPFVIFDAFSFNFEGFDFDSSDG